MGLGFRVYLEGHYIRMRKPFGGQNEDIEVILKLLYHLGVWGLYGDPFLSFPLGLGFGARFLVGFGDYCDNGK